MVQSLVIVSHIFLIGLLSNFIIVDFLLLDFLDVVKDFIFSHATDCSLASGPISIPYSVEMKKVLVP